MRRFHLGVDRWIGGERAEGIDGQVSARRSRDGVSFLAQSAVVLLDPRDMTLQGAVQGHTARAQDQLVQVLLVRRLDRDARADVRGHKRVIEHRHVRVRHRPCAVLVGEWSTRRSYDNMRRVSGAEPTPFFHQRRFTRAERPQNGGERRLAAAVLGIDQR